MLTSDARLYERRAFPDRRAQSRTLDAEGLPRQPAPRAASTGGAWRRARAPRDISSARSWAAWWHHAFAGPAESRKHWTPSSSAGEIQIARFDRRPSCPKVAADADLEALLQGHLAKFNGGQATVEYVVLDLDVR